VSITTVTNTPPTETPPPPGDEGNHNQLEHQLEAVAEEAVEAATRVGQAPFLVFCSLIGTAFAYVGEIVVLFMQTFRFLFTRGLNFGDLVRQMSVIGVDSIPIALLTVGFSGAVLALYTVNTLKDYGQADLVGGIVVLSIVRETGPIFTGIALAARAGAAIAAEIGSMKVSEQIDALRSMAVSPIEYLVVPRLVAAIIMLPIVTICANVAGIWGGGLVAAANGVPFSLYTTSMRLLMDPNGSDITRGLFKTFFFGAIVALVGCREGLETSGGATGVGQATTRSVVIAIVLVFAADFLLTFLLFTRGQS
jgi:phospholipid/cholesterol/gamma-HCH transport system permease protein